MVEARPTVVFAPSREVDPMVQVLVERSHEQRKVEPNSVQKFTSINSNQLRSKHELIVARIDPHHQVDSHRA